MLNPGDLREQVLEALDHGPLGDDAGAEHLEHEGLSVAYVDDGDGNHSAVLSGAKAG
ncbi:hypothetical protein GCM10010483_37390 [Actinokineospora diospyrosa]